MQSPHLLNTPEKKPKNKQPSDPVPAVDLPSASLQALLLFIGYVPAIAAAMEDISTSLANIDNSLNALAKMKLQKMKSAENCMPENAISFIEEIEEMLSDESDESGKNDPEGD